MDACRYCKEYHPEWQICDEYIKALEKGKVKLEGQDKGQATSGSSDE